MHAIRRLSLQDVPRNLCVALVVLAAAWAASGAGHAQIIRRAAHIPENAGGLEGFVSTCDAMVTPCLVAAAAATPLAVIGGGVAMAFGARRGMQIVLTALGVLALLGSVKGIVA
ncbi:hypothetical protein [Conexibacter sp. CPCC 206217]|uniref:hypothetical protein n=1 Tax=Conexibacter sp. CPCC 206217 TaxID=3064574 RepID=UPI00271B5290|nr:hypothetical protein [Conexibacter sp. CPCC 206217]MDO8208996.1 hypothetical protein [Conexibacter sp. CPCC 206217]